MVYFTRIINYILLYLELWWAGILSRRHSRCICSGNQKTYLYSLSYKLACGRATVHKTCLENNFRQLKPS